MSHLDHSVPLRGNVKIRRLQPPFSAANLYRGSYTKQLNAAALWLQLAVMNFDVSPNTHRVISSLIVAQQVS